MPTRHKRSSACTYFSKTRRLCKEPCKYVFRQLKDANSGMEKTIGYCKTKYNHFKKHGRKTKHHKRILKKMSKDIQKLEKATVVAKKANDEVAKVGMNMEVPSVADLSKSVGSLFSSAPAPAVEEKKAEVAPVVEEEKKAEAAPEAAASTNPLSLEVPSVADISKSVGSLVSSVTGPAENKEPAVKGGK
jgi:hypothetical protein